jgi:hypothetical protein
VGAPPPQRPGQQDRKDLQEIKARQARTEIATGIKIVIETKFATEMLGGQARLLHAQQDNILPRTTMEERVASETNNLEWSRCKFG